MAEADRINEIRERAEQARLVVCAASLHEGHARQTGRHPDVERYRDLRRAGVHLVEAYDALLALLETTGHDHDGKGKDLDAAADASDGGTELVWQIAGTAVALWIHDQDCRAYMCLARDGCDERARLFAVHDDAVAAFVARGGTSSTAPPSPSDVAPDVVPGVLCVAPEANEPPGSGAPVREISRAYAEGHAVTATGGSLASEAQRDERQAALDELRLRLIDEREESYRRMREHPSGISNLREYWSGHANGVAHALQIVVEKGGFVERALARLVDAPPGESRQATRNVRWRGAASAAASEGSGEGAC